MDGKGLQISWLALALVLAGVVSGTGPAWADSDNASGTEDGSREVVSDDPLRRQEPPDVEPTRTPRRDQLEERIGAPASRTEVDPAVLGTAPGESEPRLRREGEFIVNQRGRVIRPEGASEWIFQPTVDNDQTRKLPPMVIQPSGRLEMIETFLQDRDGEAAFEVSGRVHTYRSVNYLLLTQARPHVDPAEAEEQATSEETEGIETTEEDVDPVLEELLSARQPAPSEDAPAERPAASRGVAGEVAGSAPDASDGSLRDEGSLIMQRRGRVTRSRDGAHVMFAFEADGRESAELPMIIQPCQLLESMENIIQQRGEQVVFVVSGQVYTYQGTNYLLPSMMRLTADRGNLEN